MRAPGWRRGSGRLSRKRSNQPLRPRSTLRQGRILLCGQPPPNAGRTIADGDQWGLGLPGSGVGWQPTRFLVDRAEAERAFALAERLGSINAAAAELGTTWPSLRKAFTRHGLGMPARNPDAIRQRAIHAVHKRHSATTRGSHRPGVVALDGQGARRADRHRTEREHRTDRTWRARRPEERGMVADAADPTCPGSNRCRRTARTLSVLAFCTGLVSAGSAPVTWANDVPLETAANYLVSLDPGPNP
jgi:hypothetical protein